MGAFKSFIRQSYSSRYFQLLESCLKEFLKTRTMAREICYLLASCLFEQGKYDEARPVAVNLVSRYPDYAPGKLLLEMIENLEQKGASGVHSSTNGNSAVYVDNLGPALDYYTKSELFAEMVYFADLVNSRRYICIATSGGHTPPANACERRDPVWAGACHAA